MGGCIKAVSGGWDVLSQYQVAVGCIKAVSGGCGVY